MKTFFNYLYYRTSKFYEDWGESDGHIAGSVLASASIGFIILSFLVFVFNLYNKKVSTNIIWVVIIITGIFSLFVINKKKFIALSEKYKDEKNSKLKGWLVFLYVIGSVALYFGTMLLCGYWVSVNI